MLYHLKLRLVVLKFKIFENNHIFILLLFNLHDSFLDLVKILEKSLYNHIYKLNVLLLNVQNKFSLNYDKISHIQDLFNILY